MSNDDALLTFVTAAIIAVDIISFDAAANNNERIIIRVHVYENRLHYIIRISSIQRWFQLLR